MTTKRFATFNWKLNCLTFCFICFRWVCLCAWWVARSGSPEKLRSLGSFLHVVAWGLPAAQTVMALVRRDVNGDELTGETLTVIKGSIDDVINNNCCSYKRPVFSWYWALPSFGSESKKNYRVIYNITIWLFIIYNRLMCHKWTAIPHSYDSLYTMPFISYHLIALMLMTIMTLQCRKFMSPFSFLWDISLGSLPIVHHGFYDKVYNNVCFLISLT